MKILSYFKKIAGLFESFPHETTLHHWILLIIWKKRRRHISMWVSIRTIRSLTVHSEFAFDLLIFPIILKYLLINQNLEI